MFQRTCGFEGCTNKHRARGLCSSHLDQLARGKELTPLLGRHGQKHERCMFPGCTRKHHAGGLCHGHATQRRRGQPLRPLGSNGRWVDPKGYVFIRCPDPDHPNAKSKPGWIAEHVWVMSQLLGRPLRKGESVHHRNNIKHDNRPGNLELWRTHHPRVPASRTRSAGPAGSSRSTGRSSRRRPQRLDAGAGPQGTWDRILQVTSVADGRPQRGAFSAH